MELGNAHKPDLQTGDSGYVIEWKQKCRRVLRALVIECLGTLMRPQVGKDSEGTSEPSVSWLELNRKGELDRAGTADLVERIEAAVRAPGAQATR